jgi:hypothetical protein
VLALGQVDQPAAVRRKGDRGSRHAAGDESDSRELQGEPHDGTEERRLGAAQPGPCACRQPHHGNERRDGPAERESSLNGDEDGGERRRRQLDQPHLGGVPPFFPQSERQGLGLGGRLQLVFLVEPPREGLVRAQRGPAIAEPVEECDEAPRHRFVRRQQVGRPSRPACGLHGVPCGDLLFRHRPGAVGCPLPQPCALRLEPALERGRTRDEEPIQQVAAVEGEALCRPAAVERRLERCGVAPDDLATEPDLAVTPGHDSLLSQRIAQHVQRLVQGRARVRVVQLGPEEGKERIASLKAAGNGGGQIGEQGRALRLADQRLQVPSVGCAESQRAKNPKLDRHLSLTSL